MNDVDQRGFNNQPSDFLGAREAAEFLGVQLKTLYAYVSRGLLRSVPHAGGAEGRRRGYLRADLLRLRARHDARSGHGPVAAAALRWGEPVLQSQITAIGDGALRYRGRSAVELARDDHPFEAVAELLWHGTLPEPPPRWEARGLGVRARQIGALLPAGNPILGALSLCMPALAAQDPGRWNRSPEAVMGRGRTLIKRMAAAVCAGIAPARAAPALLAPSVAGTLAAALGARHGEEGVRALNRALILCADHELNASTFVARVAASAEADPYACVAAALAALSGARHGGVCDQIEALLQEARHKERAATVVMERARRGDHIPGSGHPLYPEGDPRAPPLIEAALHLSPRDRSVGTVLALAEAMAEQGYGLPTLDVGLVALGAALGLPPGAAVSIMAVGRAAGWIAHIIEQYQAGYLLRPRAHYVGP